MLDVVTVGAAVATALGGTLEYAPDMTMGDTQTKRVIVVPSGLSEDFGARGRKTAEATYQVAIVKRVGGNDTTSSLIAELHTAGNGCLGATYAGAVCTSVNYTTLYGVAELRGKSVYTGVFEMTLMGE